MRIISLLLICFMFFTGCSNNTKVEENDTFNIVTSFYPVYVFTQNIVKDIPDVVVTNMSNEHSGCLHDYHLTTTDMKLINSADVFVINGAGLETFLEKVYTVQEDLEVIDSSDNITLISESFSDEDNEHIWLSITNAIEQVRNISERLSEIDKNNESLYLANADAYIKRLEALRNELRESMYEYTDIKMVTSHDAFPYLADDFGFEIISVIEKEEGASPTSKEMQEIINIIKDNEIKAIFIEKNASAKIANTICSESGAKTFELDTITSGDGSLEDYENRMRENIKVIKESL